MNASIAAGIQQLPADTKAILITPVDHPAVPPVVVAALIQAWEGGALLVVPTWNERGGHPVLVDAKYRHELLSLDDARGLRGLFETHRREVTRLSVDSGYIARDMDTWDDYLSLHSEVFGVFPKQTVDQPKQTEPTVEESN